MQMTVFDSESRTQEIPGSHQPINPSFQFTTEETRPDPCHS